MKWNKTIASTCRYSECLKEILGDKEIIHEESTCDWQGGVEILADMGDGTFLYYTYSYGSCSGCDTWESSGMTGGEIAEEMKKQSAILRKPLMLKFLNSVSVSKEFVDSFKKYIGE